MMLILLLLACTNFADSTSIPSDPMWLRFPPLQNGTLRDMYLSQLSDGIKITASKTILNNPITKLQLQTAADELRNSLYLLLQVNLTTAISQSTSILVTPSTLTLHVGGAEIDQKIDTEGYSLSPNLITAKTASGALYATYRYLSYLQRHLPLPGNSKSPLLSNPAMTHRMWDLWDQLTGDVTRGFAGDSIIWPYARWKNNVGPPPVQLFIASCSDKDPFQSWSGALFDGTNVSSSMVNNGNNKCVTDQIPGGVQVTACKKQSQTTTYWYNSTVKQISIGNSSTTKKTCLDINHALGPDLDYYHCHPLGTRDYQNQQFQIEKIIATSTTDIDTPTYRLKSISAANQCITLRNGFPPAPDTPTDITYLERWDMMLRFLKSTGINSISINDVNACSSGTSLLSTPTLTNVTTNLKPALDKYAMTLYFSVCFASPTLLANITSNPIDPNAIEWWSHKVNEIYTLLPSFGGFLVKADSEGNVGPQSFNCSTNVVCTEADGANMLSNALLPHHGTLIWRAFVYGNLETKIGKEELVMQAYDTFVPLDGMFNTNVIVQIKNGPMDFQIREPLHPLLGGLKHTNVMMEVQCAQEYTGQQIHAVNLITMWKEYLGFDIKYNINGTDGTKIFDLLSNNNEYKGKPSGMACVSNLGSYGNWTGHILAQSNTYGFGRLAWNPLVTSKTINTEWSLMTFPKIIAAPLSTQQILIDVLENSRDIYEGYMSPLGIGFMVFGGYAGEGPCAPKTKGPGMGPYGMNCPVSPGRRRLDRRGGLDHYWVDPCSNYYFQNSSHDGLGCSRISKGLGGSGYSHQYHPENAVVFDDINKTPQNLLLWFHHVDWYWPNMKLLNGTTCTLIDYIRITHKDALDDVAEMLEHWKTLAKYMDETRFNGVVGRMKQQINDANVMGNKIVDFYESLVRSGV